jgi:small subunit ribosomal protein S21
MKANITAKVRDGDVAKALRILRKRCEKEGIISEMRQRVAYIKPCQWRRMAIARALAKKRKVAAKLFA